jgi:hypothetical protein
MAESHAGMDKRDKLGTAFQNMKKLPSASQKAAQELWGDLGRSETLSVGAL